MNRHLKLFSQVPVRSAFYLHTLLGKRLWFKVSEGAAVLHGGSGAWHYINPGVLVFTDGTQTDEVFATGNASVSQADRALIAHITERAQRDYDDRFDEKRLTNALLAAHRAAPIRLNDLLKTCYLDFYSDVVAGAYRHYDPKTDSMKDGWTAQHAQPKGEDRPSLESILRFLLSEEED